MTQEDRIEIAKFMESKPYSDYTKFNKQEPKDTGGLLETPSYDTWDELMPVWIKAMLWYRIQYGYVTSTFEITSLGIMIRADDKSAFKHFGLYTLEPNEPYIVGLIADALVNFCTWYNTKER